MNPFLKQVANYLYTNHRAELSEYCLVFPGRRAGVFFTAYLNELVEKPILSPEIITINELISLLTGLQQADQVSLVLKLQEVLQQSNAGIRNRWTSFSFGAKFCWPTSTTSINTC